jgi:hypothetical protein
MFIIREYKMKLRLYPDEEIDDGKIYEEDDLVLCKMPDGTIRSCGFNVNSLLMREGKSPMMTINKLEKNGDSSKNVSDLFKNFAVPAGIFYMQPKGCSNKTNEVHEEDIDDELYEKLLLLASLNHANPHKTSRKHVVHNKKNRGTKRKSKYWF